MTIEKDIRILRNKADTYLNRRARIKSLGKQVTGLLEGKRSRLVLLESREPELIVNLRKDLYQEGFELPTGIPRMRERISAIVREARGGDSFQFIQECPGGSWLIVKLDDRPSVSLDLDCESIMFFESVLSRVLEKTE